MNWTELLKNEIESAYATTANLLDKVDPDGLEWKPAAGCNWMTIGQLLKHTTEACGAACRSFITGDWGLPEGVKIEEIPPEEMLPPAEKLPTVGSVAEARKALANDRAVALKTVEQAGEEELERRKMAAPWNPGVERVLGWHLHQMVQHLERHKSQLFYYLKLQGKPVNTADLWG
ncbi:MAG: DinB family protein [Acidobacteriia bacterium]|nr:DinB family protein [Terriglobia bacterium]